MSTFCAAGWAASRLAFHEGAGVKMGERKVRPPPPRLHRRRVRASSTRQRAQSTRGRLGLTQGWLGLVPPSAIRRARSTQSSLGMAMLRCGAGVFKLTYTLRYELGLREPSCLTRCSTSTIPRTSIRSCFRATRSQVRSPPPLRTKCASGAARSFPTSHACCPSP